MLDKLCSLFCSPSNSSSSDLSSVIEPGAISVVSASCCSSTSAVNDDAMLNTVRDYIDREGLNKNINFITITDAQKALPELSKSLNAQQTQLVGQIQTLFTTQGLNVFPLLIVDQNIAFYGGIPTVDMLSEKLSS